MIRKSTKKLMILLGVTIMASMLFISCSDGTNTPEAVATKFLSAASKGEFEKAKQFCDENTTLMLNMMKSIEGEELAKRIQEGKENKIKLKIISSEINGENAVVKYNFISKKGAEVEESTIDLKKTDDKWIVSFSKEQVDQYLGIK